VELGAALVFNSDFKKNVALTFGGALGAMADFGLGANFGMAMELLAFDYRRMTFKYAPEEVEKIAITYPSDPTLSCVDLDITACSPFSYGQPGDCCSDEGLACFNPSQKLDFDPRKACCKCGGGETTDAENAPYETRTDSSTQEIAAGWCQFFASNQARLQLDLPDMTFKKADESCQTHSECDQNEDGAMGVACQEIGGGKFCKKCPGSTCTRSTFGSSGCAGTQPDDATNACRAPAGLELHRCIPRECGIVIGAMKRVGVHLSTMFRSASTQCKCPRGTSVGPANSRCTDMEQNSLRESKFSRYFYADKFANMAADECACVADPRERVTLDGSKLLTQAAKKAQKAESKAAKQAQKEATKALKADAGRNIPTELGQLGDEMESPGTIMSDELLEDR